MEDKTFVIFISAKFNYVKNDLLLKPDWKLKTLRGITSMSFLEYTLPFFTL